MGPLLLHRHTKGGRAAQPRGPGGKQWDFCSPRLRPGGQVQTTSPPCGAALLAAQRRGDLEPRRRATKEAGVPFVCRSVLLLSYRKSRARPRLVNRKRSLTVLGEGRSGRRRGGEAFIPSGIVTLNIITALPDTFHLQSPHARTGKSPKRGLIGV